MITTSKVKEMTPVEVLQLKNVLDEIRSAEKVGALSTEVLKSCPLCSEVADRLANMGYDVKIVLREDENMSFNSISWANRFNGKIGEIVYSIECEDFAKLHSNGVLAW